MGHGDERGSMLHVGEAGVAFAALSVGLTLFGILMIYSASSIMALTSAAYGYDPTYFAVHQLMNIAVGCVAGGIIWAIGYRALIDRWFVFLVAGTLLFLGLVLTPFAGRDAYGATRWISFGPLHLQPSEIAKVTLVLIAAKVMEDEFKPGSVDLRSLALRLAVLVGPALLLVLKQPDKGSVLIVGLTVVLMLYLAGIPGKYIAAMFAAFIGLILLVATTDEYSRARILIMRDPWTDPYNAGYQLIQGYYAFGSGGIRGVGLGMSRQKYSYLPMAHNDFIFAVIGEELGLIGTVCVLLAFLALVYLGYRIAQNAPDLAGRLSAAGSVTLLMLQLLVNVCGVLGIIPLSGKPIPFLSYGGSSIIATLMLVGLVLSVARAGSSPYAQREGAYRVYEGTGARGLRVITGGARPTTQGLRSQRGQGQTRLAVGGGRPRIDLGPSGAERLRR